MITSKLFAICERAMVDQVKQDLSLIGIIDEIKTFVPFPVPLPPFTLVLWTERLEDVDDQITLDIVASIEEEEVFTRAVGIDYQKQKKNRLMMNFQGMPVPKAGVLQFSAHYAGEKFASMDIVIHSSESEGEFLTSVEQG